MNSERSPSLAWTRRPFRHYMKEHTRAFILGLISLFFTNAFDVLTPLALKFGIDSISERNPRNLGLAISLYIGVMCGVTLFRYLWRIHFGRFHHSAADDLRNRIYEKLTELGPSFYQKNPVGQLMSLITNDVNSFRMGIGPGLLILLDGFFLVAMTLPVMFTLSADWTWKSLILLPLLPFFMRRMEHVIHERFRTEQDRLSIVSGHAQETVMGIRVLKSFAQEDHHRARFNRFSQDYEEACNKVAKVDSAFHPVMEASVAVGSSILLWLCSDDVVRGAITLGTFVAFHEYIRRMIWPMTAIGLGLSMIEQGRASFARIRDVLSTETDIPDSGSLDPCKFNSISLHGLTFQYPESPRPTLQDIELTIHAGETIGIVGPVGSGKSTLLQLITRLFPTTPGQIKINGLNLQDVQRSSLRRLISYVTQDAFLFSETVARNIALGLRAVPQDPAIQQAARLVNIDQEIQEMPGGYDAYLGERGVNLSGGQKQRLTIARALIRRSSLVLLDDSLSAVDGTTERAIIDELKKARAENPRQTVVIVSHRLATLKHADRIVVLNRGRIEAIGRHDELLSSSPTYRDLHDRQSAGDEP